MKIHIYQHSAGDFKLTWRNDTGEGEELNLGFDLGGAICFALGLKIGAEVRGERVELTFNLRNPRINHGFNEGFRRGYREVKAGSSDIGYSAIHQIVPPPLRKDAETFAQFASEGLSAFLTKTH